MKKDKKIFHESSTLRRKAEEKLAEKSKTRVTFPVDGDNIRLIHELEVHQVELEMQNEELKAAVDIAEAATEKYTLLYDFAPAGYFTLDYDVIIQELNLNGALMLGRERESLIGTNFKNFVSIETREAFSEFFIKLLETGSKQTCDVTLKSQNNLSRYCHLEGIISQSKKNCLIAAIDITERKVAEDRVKDNEVRLLELNATKDKFFSIIAHDLKGPFTSIIGFSGLLIDHVQNKDYKGIFEYAEFIQESSFRAMSLLSNLLEWARLQTGSIKFNPVTFNISDVVEDVAELSKDPARQKKITLSYEVPKNTFVVADREMIGNVLRNLVSNAIKFTNPEGKITISARQDQEELMMMVSDNGVGIESNKLKELFRIESNHSTKGTQNEVGTGLGLILCKEFILKHGGKIWVESDQGKGSTFYFTIPEAL
jgi:PAS domain S-box-containing protein